jgi:hypothetical protein
LAALAKIRRLYRIAPVQGIPPLARFANGIDISHHVLQESGGQVKG